MPSRERTIWLSMASPFRRGDVGVPLCELLLRGDSKGMFTFIFSGGLGKVFRVALEH
jgi:hypothetical protein